VSRNPVRRDTRKHARATLELPVIVSDAANRVHGAIRFASADVSGGGAFLRSDMLFEIGELLTLEFDLPGGRHVRARGRVVRVSRGAGQTGRGRDDDAHRDPRDRDRYPGMGVEFVDLDPADRTAIEERLS
jgi:hypothetical protein